MKPHSNLQISKHGICYLRIQRGGIDRRISLRTRDQDQATIAVAHTTIFQMKINQDKKFRNWIDKIECDSL